MAVSCCVRSLSGAADKVSAAMDNHSPALAAPNGANVLGDMF
jgi:hypothetical protein